jgi:hypothetical protein
MDDDQDQEILPTSSSQDRTAVYSRQIVEELKHLRGKQDLVTETVFKIIIWYVAIMILFKILRSLHAMYKKWYTRYGYNKEIYHPSRNDTSLI